MKFYMVALFILGMTTLSMGECPRYWRYFDKNCYLIQNGSLNWHQARYKCASVGGQLAVIYNKYVNEFLREQAFLSGTELYWIGLSDLRDEGKFRWEATGRIVGYTNWYPHQPDNYKGAEDCAHLWKKIRYYWNDGQCQHKSGYICQRRVKGCRS